MKCVICKHGATKPGLVTVTLQKTKQHWLSKMYRQTSAAIAEKSMYRKTQRLTYTTTKNSQKHGACRG
ncbi:MAG: hypothetical protein NPIRA02_41100 [Nitrospirales bacterium]|nr:MAG: hypothetical protein NPIRA02_41100 [Nitrospirales bacterium]